MNNIILTITITYYPMSTQQAYKALTRHFTNLHTHYKIAKAIFFAQNTMK